MSQSLESKYPPVRFGDHHYFVMEADAIHSVTWGRFTDLQGNPVPIPKGALCYDLVSGKKQLVQSREEVWILYHMNDMNHNHKFDIYIEGSEELGPIITIRPWVKLTSLTTVPVKLNTDAEVLAKNTDKCESLSSPVTFTF
jgi:hypothetical protein